MNRSGPPARRTPLDSRSQLRRTPFARPTTQELRSAPLTQQRTVTRMPRQRRPEKTAAPKAPRYTGPPLIVTRAVDKRDMGRCLVCGGQSSNRQHREGRGAGGRGKDDAARTNGVAWLFHVCGQGNGSGCHKAIDNDPLAFDKGWKIRRNGPEVDAATVPLLCFDGWHLLTDDGQRVECPAPEGWTA